MAPSVRWPIAISLVLAIGPVAAQESVSTTDIAGDAKIAGSAPAAFLDIIAATATLSAGNLSVSIALADADQAEAVAPASYVTGSHEYWAAIRYRDETFHAVIYPDLGQVPVNPVAPSGDRTTASLFRELPTATPPWERIMAGTARFDRTLGGFAAEFPLSELKDTEGFLPGPGETIWIDSITSYADEGPGTVHEAPRGGRIPGPFASGQDEALFAPGTRLVIPGLTTGGIALSTPFPIRFSNGEATTFHWPLSLTNNVDEGLQATITVQSDGQTEVRVPDLVSLPEGGSKTVDVFATVPFVHEHGGQRRLTLSVRAGPHEAQMNLEIRYLEIPQPAGHHPLLALHKLNGEGPQPRAGWMDTVLETEETHSDDMEFDLGFCRAAGSPRTEAPVAVFPLNPPLLIGISARPDETAQLAGTLDFQFPQRPSHLMALMIVYDPVNSDILLAGDIGLDERTVSLPIPLTPQPGSLPFVLDVPLPVELQRLAPGSGLNLALGVAVCPDASVQGVPDPSAAQVIADQAPTLRHGATLLMPLNEFHDTIPIAALNGPILATNQAEMRIVPGGTALWEVEVAGNSSHYDLEIFGTAAADAVLHASSVKAGGTVAVSLTLPLDARPGDVFEVILSAHAREERDAASAIRLTATVDPTGGDNATEVAKLSSPPKSSPAPSLGIAFLALAIMAWWPRRS